VRCWWQACFWGDVLICSRKILISHLIDRHRLPTTSRQPHTTSDHRIPSETSSTRGRRNIEVRKRRQVHLARNFLIDTPSLLKYLFLRGAASSTYPTVTTNPSWPTDPLEYIAIERETKYGGEMLI
jgi:hypothetical protein